MSMFVRYGSSLQHFSWMTKTVLQGSAIPSNLRTLTEDGIWYTPASLAFLWIPEVGKISNSVSLSLIWKFPMPAWISHIFSFKIAFIVLLLGAAAVTGAIAFLVWKGCPFSKEKYYCKLLLIFRNHSRLRQELERDRMNLRSKEIRSNLVFWWI